MFCQLLLRLRTNLLELDVQVGELEKERWSEILQLATYTSTHSPIQVRRFHGLAELPDKIS